MPELLVLLAAVAVTLRDSPVLLAITSTAIVIAAWVVYLILRQHWHKIPKHSATRLRSFVKATTWRLIGSLDTFGLAWLVTGHLGFAGSIASLEIITKIAWFYLHERIWDMITWGHIRCNAQAAAPSDYVPRER